MCCTDKVSSQRRNDMGVKSFEQAANERFQRAPRQWPPGFLGLSTLLIKDPEGGRSIKSWPSNYHLSVTIWDGQLQSLIKHPVFPQTACPPRRRPPPRNRPPLTPPPAQPKDPVDDELHNVVHPRRPLPPRHRLQNATNAKTLSASG